MSALDYHVLMTLHDAYLEPFLDRFQDDFPANEQIYASSFLRMLRKKEEGRNSGSTLLCALEGEGGPLAGIACYDIEEDKSAAVLWYLSIHPEKRSQGLGSQVYQEIVRRVRVQYPEARFLIYEVERPDQAHTAKDSDLALRRINFYRRNGGQVCANVVYRQKVRKEPAVMMYLMAHAFASKDRTPESILEAVRSTFGGSMEPVETLILD